jgi:transposase
LARARRACDIITVTICVNGERRYRNRWLIEAMFRRLKDFRRDAARYDKLAALSTALAAVAAFLAGSGCRHQ